MRPLVNIDLFAIGFVIDDGVVGDFGPIQAEHISWLVQGAVDQSEVQIEHDLQVTLFIRHSNDLIALASWASSGLLTEVVKSESENCDWQKDQVDEETPEFVQDPNEDFVGDEQGCLTEVSANLLKFLERGRLVSKWMHEIAPLNV